MALAKENMPSLQEKYMQPVMSGQSSALSLCLLIIFQQNPDQAPSTGGSMNKGPQQSGRAQAFPAEDISLLKTPKDLMPLYVYLMAPESINVNGQCIDAQPK